MVGNWLQHNIPIQVNLVCNLCCVLLYPLPLLEYISCFLSVNDCKLFFSENNATNSQLVNIFFCTSLNCKWIWKVYTQFLFPDLLVELIFQIQRCLIIGNATPTYSSPDFSSSSIHSGLEKIKILMRITFSSSLCYYCNILIQYLLISVFNE